MACRSPRRSPQVDVRWASTSVLCGTLIGGSCRFEQLHETTPGGLVQQQLVSAPVRTRLYAGSQRTAYALFESCCGCDVIWMRGCSCLAGLCATDDLGFEVPDGPAAFGGAVGELAAAVVVGFSKERLAVTLCEPTGVDQLDRLIGQLKESDGVGQVAAASPESACEVSTGDVEVVE